MMYHFLSPDDFYGRMKQRMSLSEGEQINFLVSIDFDNFNFINDLFGYHIGDLVLERVTRQFDKFLKEDEFFTRVHADHFIFWMSGNPLESYSADDGSPANLEQALVKRLNDITYLPETLKNLLPSEYRLVSSGGIVNMSFPDIDALTLSGILDKANFARKQAKGNHVNTFFFYDKPMDEGLEWKKVITSVMESAIQNGEFEMYLQPKMTISDRLLVGAEALVRWKSERYGMIYPDKFIPILEQNGFIKKLDFFMLEQACKLIKSHIEQGRSPLPISVNFSKVHVQNPKFVEEVFQTVNGYKIPTNLIELEITENLITDDFQTLVNMSTELKYLGFTVSLDDFGRAYSSLHYLKDLPLDVIKIDKGFLASTHNTGRGRVIIAKIVNMIKSLGMVSVMEGVETEEQVQFLQELGCDIGQGYFYARPMPVSDYEKLILTVPTLTMHKNDFKDLSVGDTFQKPDIHDFQMDSWELYTLGQNIDMGLMKGYLDGEFTVQYVNDRALEYIGYTRCEFREILRNNIYAFTHPDDTIKLKQLIKDMISTGKPHQFVTRALRKDGKIIVLKGRASCVIDRYGRPVGLYALQDATEELERTEQLQRALEEKVAQLESLVTSERASREKLRVTEERYRLIVEQSDDAMFDWDLITDSISFSGKLQDILGCSTDETGVITSTEIRELVCPEDQDIFDAWIRSTINQSGSSKAEFRIRRNDGNYIWICSRSTTLTDDSNIPIRAVGSVSDIDLSKRELAKLTIKSQLDPLTHLYNKEESRRLIENLLLNYPKQQPYNAAFFMVDIDNFKGINDHLGHQFGDSVLQDLSARVKAIFREGDIVGRFGGDEIVIFMNNCHDKVSVQAKAQHLLSTLRKSYFGEKTKYDVSVSIGIAFFPSDGTTFEELYHCADVALYESKGNGKNCYTIYEDDVNIQGDFKDTIKNTGSRTPLDSPERFLNAYFASDPIFSIFEMLYETKDIITTIKRVLEVVGQRFQACRVYIFQTCAEQQSVSNTFEWCAEGVESRIKQSPAISMPDMEGISALYNSEGIFYCSNVDGKIKEILKAMWLGKAKSILQCAIYKEGVINGFIGLDTFTERIWRGEEIATLGYISRVLSVFLLKTQIKRDLLYSYENHRAMLDNLDGYVYVIDKQNYDLLFVNNATKEHGFCLGNKCYSDAFGIDSPCENCPAKKVSQNNIHAVEKIYSDKLDKWVRCAASLLYWDDRKDAVLICCTDITQYINQPPK